MHKVKYIDMYEGGWKQGESAIKLVFALLLNQNSSWVISNEHLKIPDK